MNRVSIREYAKAYNVEVVGPLRRISISGRTLRDQDGTPYRLYVDDAMNEYTINRNGICIITVDGNVI